MKRLFIVLSLALGLVLGTAGTAGAWPKPSPLAGKSSVAKRLAAKKRVLPPTQVWVNVETAAPDGLLGFPAFMTSAFYNGYTVTKFNCSRVMTKTGPTCINVPCPQASYCLTVRWGQVATGIAKYEPVFCAGGCVRAGRITVDPDEAPFGGIHPWGPYQRTLVMERLFGLFIGLPENTECVDVMNATYRCNGDDVPNTLQPSNAALAGAF